MSCLTKPNKNHEPNKNHDLSMYLPVKNARIYLTAIIVIGICSLAGTIVTFRELFSALDPILSPRRDFIQEFLLAKAAAAGVDPYLSLEVLAKKMLTFPVERIFPHPSPHPPGLLMLIIPLGYMSYFTAQIFWFGLQLIFLAAIVFLCGHAFSWKARSCILFALLILASRPGYVELVQGQLGLLLAFFAVLSIYLIKQGKVFLAGLCVGVLFSAKLFGAPLILYFFLKRRWMPFLGCLLSFGISQLFACAIVGPSTVSVYYLDVLPSVTPFYQLDIHNLSFLTLASKLTVGSSAGVLHPVSYPALFPENSTVQYLVWAVVSVLALASFLLSLKCEPLKAMLVLFGAQLVFSPIVWIHGYVVLLALLPWYFAYFTRINSAYWIALCLAVFVGDAVADMPGITKTPIEPLVVLVPAVILTVYLTLSVKDLLSEQESANTTA